MNTHNTPANAVRRTLGTCAVFGAALVGLAQPQIATAQTEISASIAPAQRYRAPDNGSSTVAIVASDAAAGGQLAQPVGAGDLKSADVQAAEHGRLMQVKAAEGRPGAFMLKAAEGRPGAFMLKAAEGRPGAFMLKAAEGRPGAFMLKAAEGRPGAFMLKAAEGRPGAFMLKAAEGRPGAFMLKAAEGGRMFQLKAAEGGRGMFM